MVDDFLSGIRKFQRKLERLASVQSVAFTELFSEEFILRHTDFASISAFFAASSFTLETNDDFVGIDESELDALVAANSRFASWEDMKAAAAGEWMSRQLREG